MLKTLYISDLDGTLLHSNEKISYFPQDTLYQGLWEFQKTLSLQLKEYLGCDKLVVFGDGLNDIEMFYVADECYAVENAAPELREIADGIIGSNNDDGVARWLKNHYM